MACVKDAHKYMSNSFFDDRKRYGETRSAFYLFSRFVYPFSFIKEK